MGEDIGQDPSSTAGATIPPHIERLHAAMGEVVPLLESDNEADATQAAAAYVGRRAQELSASDPGRLIGKDAGVTRGTQAFIGPGTSLSLTGMGRAFHLDDPTAYEAAFTAVRANYVKLGEQMPPELAYLNSVIAGANYGQAVLLQRVFRKCYGEAGRLVRHYR